MSEVEKTSSNNNNRNNNKRSGNNKNNNKSSWFVDSTAFHVDRRRLERDLDPCIQGTLKIPAVDELLGVEGAVGADQLLDVKGAVGVDDTMDGGVDVFKMNSRGDRQSLKTDVEARKEAGKGEGRERREGGEGRGGRAGGRGVSSVKSPPRITDAKLVTRISQDGKRCFDDDADDNFDDNDAADDKYDDNHDDNDGEDANLLTTIPVAPLPLIKGAENERPEDDEQVASTTSLSQTCSSLLQRSRSSSSSLQQELSVDDSSDAFSSSSMSDLEGKDDDDNNDGDDDDVEDEGDKSDDIKADNDDGKESRSPTSSSAGKTNQCSNEQHAHAQGSLQSSDKSIEKLFPETLKESANVFGVVETATAISQVKPTPTNKLVTPQASTTTSTPPPAPSPTGIKTSPPTDLFLPDAAPAAKTGTAAASEAAASEAAAVSKTVTASGTATMTVAASVTASKRMEAAASGTAATAETAATSKTTEAAAFPPAFQSETFWTPPPLPPVESKTEFLSYVREALNAWDKKDDKDQPRMAGAEADAAKNLGRGKELLVGTSVEKLLSLQSVRGTKAIDMFGADHSDVSYSTSRTSSFTIQSSSEDLDFDEEMQIRELLALQEGVFAAEAALLQAAVERQQLIEQPQDADAAAPSTSLCESLGNCFFCFRKTI